jgi:transcriptional regulator NrdR family protein
MRCDNCGSEDCYVVDSRVRTDGIRRRRWRCAACAARFNSVEIPERVWAMMERAAMAVMEMKQNGET